MDVARLRALTLSLSIIKLNFFPIEIHVARLRALTHYKSNSSIVFTHRVEMDVARLRALTPVLTVGLALGS